VLLNEDDGDRQAAINGKRLPTHTLSELLIPMSGAIDLAEGREPGHGQRVAYIAMSLSRQLSLDSADSLTCCYAGLFHDVGVIQAGVGMSGLGRKDEQRIFAALPLLAPEEAALDSGSHSPDLVADRIVDHALYGGRIAKELALPEETIVAISCHHERWDGMGYPHALEGQDIPVVARVLGLADNIESVISREFSPLVARRNLQTWLASVSGSLADPEMVRAARSLTAGDEFWLGLYSASLPSDLRDECGRLKEARLNRVMTFAERFAEFMDSRFSFTVGASLRVANLAESLGASVGLTQLRIKQLRLAALLHDIGQLGIPERIMSKPGILSVEELEVLRQHPIYARDIIAGVPGLDEVGDWVGAHHERPDGRGYPEGRTDIPLEARILAIADAFVAITSDRPHRRGVDQDDGVQRLYGAAGSQLDAGLLKVFVERVVA
jgi:HD-GYP domain-containing protein (c-di-GMP phosphodiesterase class II)